MATPDLDDAVRVYREALAAYRQALKARQDASEASQRADTVLYAASDATDMARNALINKASDGAGGPVWNIETDQYEDQPE